ncbi:MAG: hypothetical protein ACFFB2_18870 [Promethearchaeota archaeon]
MITDDQYRIEELLSQSRYEEAQVIVQKLEQIENLRVDEYLRCLLYKTRILIGKGALRTQVGTRHRGQQ